MSLKIAIIGAGSQSFGPLTIRDILLSEPLNEMGLKLMLMDVSEKSLPPMEDYAKHVARELGRKAQIISTPRLFDALDNSDFVITAVEANRFKYWAQDFHIPRKYGFRQVFGENGGPGSLFHAMRNMRHMVDIAKEMERLCPGAYLINFSNPEHKLGEALSRLTNIRNVSLCHGYFMGLRQIARMLGREPDSLDAAAAGINHFTWFQYIRDKATGEDLYPALRAAEREGDLYHQWHELALGRVLFRRFGLWPSPGANHYGEYLGWAHDFVCAEYQYYHDPTSNAPWVTGDIPDMIYDILPPYPWKKETATREPLTNAPLKPSGEVAVAIMEGLALEVRREIPAVNITNYGSIPNLPDEMVVEVPCVADAEGLIPVQMAPLPEGIAAMLRTQGSINELLVQAWNEGSRDKLLQAFLLEPTVDSYPRAVACIDEMIALQQVMLPEFRPWDDG